MRSGFWGHALCMLDIRRVFQGAVEGTCKSNTLQATLITRAQVAATKAISGNLFPALVLFLLRWEQHLAGRDCAGLSIKGTITIRQPGTLHD